MVVVEIANEARHVVSLIGIGEAVHDLQRIGGLRSVHLRLGQQLRSDAQLLFAISVVEVEQIAWRTIVDEEVVESVAPTSLPQDVERVELGAHEREDGLLGIAEIDNGGIGSGDAVDDGQLEGVEVLHLVYLYPLLCRYDMATG